MSHPQSLAVRWLMEQLRLAGVDWLLICPGSRSTPLVQAAAEVEAAGHWRIDIVADERQAGFAALGLARVGRHPAVLTTSGSAVAHLLPACVEAGETGVALLLVTADRPPQLRDCGAPQTVRQPALLKSYAQVVDLDLCAGLDDAQSALARSAVAAWKKGNLVHLNVCLDTPLALQGPAWAPLAPELTEVSQLPTFVAARPGQDARPEDVASTGGGLDVAPPASGERVVLIAGPLQPDQALVALVPALCSRAVVLAEWTSQLAGPAAIAGAPRSYDALLRDPELLYALRPDRIVRLGEWPASKGLQQLLERAKSLDMAVEAVWGARRSDPLHQVTLASNRPPEQALAAWAQTPEPKVDNWRALWRTADEAARLAAKTLPTDDWELAAVRVVAAELSPATVVVVGNSMPVRDMDALNLSPPTCARILCSRGANGIDGTLAMAWGAALGTLAPTRVYLGDCAFLHDIGSLQLLAARQSELDLRVLVVDNDGGAIFDYLPARAAMTQSLHERCFTAPHGLDLVPIARGFGLEAQCVTSEADLERAWLAPGRGVRIVVFRVARPSSLRRHREWQNVQAAAAIAALALATPC